LQSSRFALAFAGLLLLAAPQALAGGTRLAAPAVPERAHAVVAEGHLEARLLFLPARNGGLRVGVLFDLASGWHTYWKNPGDSGLAGRVRFSGVGERAGSLRWPAPAAFAEADGELVTYGYGDQVLLFADVPAPLPGSGFLGAEVDVLVCERECIPASFSLVRPFASARAPDRDPHTDAIFAHYEAALPRRAEDLGIQIEALFSQSGVRPGDRFEAALLVTPCPSPRDDECFRPPRSGLHFFPEAPLDVAWRESGRVALPDALAGETAGAEFAVALVGERNEDGEADALRLRGVLALRDQNGAPAPVAIDLPFPAVAPYATVEALPVVWRDAAPPTRQSSPLSLYAALLLAFAGGVILNLMPCVLPVLAIKVFGVADLAHRSRREVWAHGAAYTGGILLSMATLALVVIALRGAGHAVGWGFQFQEPLFIALVCTVVVAFALNLMGVFEIEFAPNGLVAVGAEATGARRSFFEGLLAVVLATPCSAPFLGTAVGFAFASAPLRIVAVFLTIGAGLAAPYALVCAVPAWGRIIPRPGAWMVKLRAGLGFTLLGSAVWLVWILGRSAGTDAVAGLLAFLVLIGFLAWIYGNSPQRPTWLPAGLLAIVLLAGLLGARHFPAPEGGSREPSSNKLGQPYDPAGVRHQLTQGRSTFVYFTADWCLTCKVNERRVLADDWVRSEIERLGVAVFRADWTHRDETIRAELARYGKAGVPVYVVRHPEAPDEPIVLPELLTREQLVRSLRGEG